MVAPHREPLQAGSSFSPQIPSEFNIHAVFGRKDPEFLHTHVLIVPLPNPLRMNVSNELFCFFVFLFYYGFDVLGCLGLTGCHISDEKRKIIKGSAGAY